MQEMWHTLFSRIAKLLNKGGVDLRSLELRGMELQWQLSKTNIVTDGLMRTFPCVFSVQNQGHILKMTCSSWRKVFFMEELANLIYANVKMVAEIYLKQWCARRWSDDIQRVVLNPGHRSIDRYCQAGKGTEKLYEGVARTTRSVRSGEVEQVGTLPWSARAREVNL